MSLRTVYDNWHQRIYEADPSHEDASSPWYQVVREYLGEVAGLCVLEVACGRGGFIRQMANAGAPATGCDFSSSALRAARTKIFTPHCPPLATPGSGGAQNVALSATTFDAAGFCATI